MKPQTDGEAEAKSMPLLDNATKNPWWLPYTELMRLKSPAPVLLIYLPCLYGTTMISTMIKPTTSPAHLLALNCKLLLGVFIFRSFGCAWNDIVDQDLDRQVTRTRNRPLARGAISTEKALIFAAFQFVLGVSLTIYLVSLKYMLSETPCVVGILLYPFAKRFTDFPQLILGFTNSSGVLLAFVALNVPSEELRPKQIAAAWTLYSACTIWFVLYDTIYAAQDVEDDKRIGTRSTMTRFQERAPVFLRALAALQWLSILFTGYLAGCGYAFFSLSLILGVALGYMVFSVDLESKENCAWWCSKGSIGVALLMASVFLSEYLGKICTQ